MPEDMTLLELSSTSRDEKEVEVEEAAWNGCG
jgi:hypothetical protein